MRILIVDDEEDIRLIARYALSGSPDIEVLDAASGQQAVSTAAKEKPDVILLDMMMPVMDGRQTFAELRKNPNTSAIPVIFLTGTRNPDELQTLRDMGVRAILSKPFDPRTLKRDILMALSIR